MSAANQHLTFCVLDGRAIRKYHCCILGCHCCCGGPHSRFGPWGLAQHWDVDLQGPQCMLLLRSFRRSMGRRRMYGAQVWWRICCYVHACPGRETSPSPPQISMSPWVMARASIERCSLIWHQIVHTPVSLTVHNQESKYSYAQHVGSLS